MSAGPEIIDLSMKFFHATPAAVRVSNTDHDADAVWLPKSMIEMDPPEPERGDVVTITLPVWKAEKEGLV